MQKYAFCINPSFTCRASWASYDWIPHSKHKNGISPSHHYIIAIKSICALVVLTSSRVITTIYDIVDLAPSIASKNTNDELSLYHQLATESGIIAHNGTPRPTNSLSWFSCQVFVVAALLAKTVTFVGKFIVSVWESRRINNVHTN